MNERDAAELGRLAVEQEALRLGTFSEGTFRDAERAGTSDSVLQGVHAAWLVYKSIAKTEDVAACQARITVESTADPLELRQPPSPDDLLTPAQVRRYLGNQVSLWTLAQWRVSGAGPRFTSSGRRILYRRRHVDDWLASREKTFTRETPAPPKATREKARKSNVRRIRASKADAP